MIIRSIIIIFMLVAITASCNFKTADDYILESNTVADKGDFIGAIKLIDKAIEKNSKHKGAYLNRGLCHEKLGNFKAAIIDYENLLSIDPNNVAAYYDIGTCKHDLNNFQDAINYYNKALGLKGYSDTSTSITVDLVNNGFIEDAKFDIPTYEIVYQRGLAFYQLNQFRHSIRDFESCILQQHNSNDCHYMIALCYIESGNKEKGCDELHKCALVGDTLALRKQQELCK